MNFSEDAPLSRIKGETQKAHNALMDYFLMGAGRSLAKLHRKYTNTTLNKPPTLHIETLKIWSGRWHWQARIAQQAENENAIILAQIEKDNAAKLAKWQAQHMSEAEALAILALQARGNMADFAGVRAQADLAENPNAALVKNITQHYTQTTKGTGEDAQAEIKARIILGLYDAQRALELILKHHGSFEKDNKSEIIMKLEESPLERIRSRIDSIATNKAESNDSRRPDNG